MVPVLALAEAFCFATAETYYEQVYCEVQARGVGASLPPLHEFRNNPEITQALLLRPSARQLGITLVMPDPTTEEPAAPPIEPSAERRREPSAQPALRPGSPADPGAPGCRQDGPSLVCGESRYVFVGNRRNTALGDGALAPANRLALPAFEGTVDDRDALDDYLSRSYRRYIHKMRDIGLAGATMTYWRFALLFEDMLRLGIDFSERAETMFSHLKRDKANLAVTESGAPPALDTHRCLVLDSALVVCAAGRRNYVFERQGGSQ